MKNELSILKRRLKRLNSMLNKLEKKHIGNELKYTYWGGYSLEYLKGKIGEIENQIDSFDDKKTSNR